MGRMEFQHRPLVKWPRLETPAGERKGNVFPSTLNRTLQLLARELAALKSINPILITTDHHAERDVRIDGLPRTDIRQPKQPGVIIEFFANTGRETRDRLQYACDRFQRWEHNLHAIMLTLQSLRAVDRYGATAAGEQYSGFKALPPPQALLWTVEDAARFLAGVKGVNNTADSIIASPMAFESAYRSAVKVLHPDAGGSAGQWADLQRAQESLQRHLDNDHAPKHPYQPRRRRSEEQRVARR
jgi:hypothetical protein